MTQRLKKNPSNNPHAITRAITQAITRAIAEKPVSVGRNLFETGLFEFRVYLNFE
jgi:hypothetical protein